MKTITVDTLLRLGAPHEGIEDFRRQYPDGLSPWTKADQLALLRGPCRKHLTWAVDKGILPVLFSMKGENLMDAGLRGADLRDADLRGANLQGADLADVLHDDGTRWPEGANR